MNRDRLEVDQVWTVAFSPNGRWLVSGQLDGLVRLWDAGSCEEVACLFGHARAVTGVAFSPDGRWIVSSSRDATVRVWDPETRKQVACLCGHDDGVTSVAFSPDGRLVVSGSHDHTVRLWDAGSWEEVACLRGHASAIMSVALSPDGRWIVSGSLDLTMRVWDVEARGEVACLYGRPSPVMWVAFSPGGRWVVSGEGDGTLWLCDAASWEKVACLRGHVESVTELAFSPDGRRIVSGSEDWSVRVWDAEAREQVACLSGHEDAVRSVAFSPDGRWIVSGSHDCTVRVWDAETGTCLHSVSMTRPRPGPTLDSDSPFPVTEGADEDIMVDSDRQFPVTKGADEDIIVDSDGPFRAREKTRADQTLLLPRAETRGVCGDAADDAADDVDCTVLAPPQAPTGDHIMVQVYAHLPELPQLVMDQAREFDEGAGRRGATSLGTRIGQGVRLAFEVALPELVVPQPVREVTWRGHVEWVSFDVYVPPDARVGSHIGTVLIAQESVPIGEVRFRLTVVPLDGVVPPARRGPVGQARRYETAFISYASRDREEVLRCVRMLSPAGIEFWQDVLSLEPADRWEEEMWRHIDESDVMFLFWSTAARESEWVQKEWHYALEHKGDDYIRPVIIEGPPPVPPPRELSHLHFDDKVCYFLKATAGGFSDTG